MPALKYWDAVSGTWQRVMTANPAPEVHISTYAPSTRDAQLLWVDTDESYSNPYVVMAELVGPWNPAYCTVTVPFVADVLVQWSASWWAPAIGLSDCNLYVDTGFVGNWAGHYFNEASSHKTVSSCIVLRAMTVGVHTFGIGHARNAFSDTNDRAHITWTMVQV